MKMFWYLGVCVVLFGDFSTVSTAKLPNYITPCSKSDPNLIQCGITNGRRAIPELLKGDKKFKLPNFLPFHLDRISLSPSENINITLTKCELYGLDTIDITGFDFDEAKKIFKVHLTAEEITLKAHYEINGRVLILPIVGEGPIEIKIDKSKIFYGFTYNLIEKNGKQYMTVMNPEAELISSRTHYKLENLFNGDKRLGDEMNVFLNENWRDVSKDLNPSVTETISAIATSIITGLTKRIPYEDILLA